MPRHISFPEALAATSTRAQLCASGLGSRDIAKAVAAGELRRLQRNRYVRANLWNDLWPESRHRIEVGAAVGEMRGGSAVTSHESAGVAWTLPLYRHTPATVHITMPTGERLSSRHGLKRHSDNLPDEDITTMFGVRCTTLDRTVFDLARTLSPEAAISVADAALRQVAMIGKNYDTDAAERWRQRMLERCSHAKGVRGVRQATDSIRFADGRAELPGESVSRLQLSRLGFRSMGLQVPVPGPHGTDYRVDLEIEDVRTFFEFDGTGKYLDEATRSGRTIEQVMLDEKRREDWIRGTTQKRLVRAESTHIATTRALAERLAAFGITPPGR